LTFGTMPMRKATKDDYVKLQGGLPKVSQDERGLWHIKHSYRNDMPDVTDHRPPSEGQEVNINGVLYNARLLWQFHGAPCERQSHKVGGVGYPRGESGERSKA